MFVLVRTERSIFLTGWQATEEGAKEVATEVLTIYGSVRTEDGLREQHTVEDVVVTPSQVRV